MSILRHLPYAILSAGLLAAGAIILSGIMDVEQSYRAIGWTTVILVGAMMPLVLIVFGVVWWMVRAAQTFVASPRQPVTIASALKPAEPVPEPAGADTHGSGGH